MRSHIDESMQRLEKRDARYFAERLPAAQSWRLFPDFRDSVAYVDIETTGMGDPGDYITTIALYDGKSVFCYVRGENLEQFKEDIKKYQVLITYNGKCFDVPFIQNHLGIPMDHAHIDLRYVLRSLGYGGGLKGCERQLGIDREELEGVDGYFAVLLWEDYRRNRNPKALETLLAYNVEDTVNLETLMVISYNLKVMDTPFHVSHTLDRPSSPMIPYEADPETIRKIRQRLTGNDHPPFFASYRR